MKFSQILIITALIMFPLYYLYSLYAKTHKTFPSYPPVVAECPDYWKITARNQCENVRDIGSCKTGDFSAQEYQGHAGLVRKCQWARQCGAAWEGVNDPSIC